MNKALFLKLFSFLIIFSAVPLTIITIQKQQDMVQRVEAAQGSLALPQTPIIAYALNKDDPEITNKFRNAGMFDVANIVAGNVEDPNLIAEFKSKGILYTYVTGARVSDWTTSSSAYPDCHSETTIEKCARLIAEEVTKPYRNTLNGYLPNGFESISFDELLVYPEDSLASKVQIELLRQIRLLYPQKIFLAYGSRLLSNYPKLMQAVYDYVDLFMMESYLSEMENTSRFAEILKNPVQNLNPPQLVNKTLIAVAVDNRESFAFDRNPSVDFKDFLDAEVHFLKNTEPTNHLKGISFWPLYGADPDTVKWAALLAKHYYLENKTDFLSPNRGNFVKNFVRNSSFENGLDGWTLKKGATGFFDYGFMYPSPLCNSIYTKASIPHVPHGIVNVQSYPPCKTWGKSTALKMQKSSTVSNKISQTVNIRPNTQYWLKVYAKNQTPNHYSEPAKGKVSIKTADGKVITSTTHGTVFCNVYPNPRFGTCNPEYNTFTKYLLQFKSGSTTNQVVISLSDENAALNTTTLWDFVEFEESHGIPVLLSYKIAGYIFEDTNENGRWDATTGEKVTIANIFLSGAATGNYRTANNGRYEFSNLSPEDYSINISVPGGYWATTSPLVNKTLNQDTRVDFGVAKINSSLNKIAGYIFVDTNKNGKWDGTTETGYKNGATMTLSGAKSKTIGSSEIGRYEFANLAKGSYTVKINLPSGYSSTTPNNITKTLGPSVRLDFGIVLN